MKLHYDFSFFQNLAGLSPVICGVLDVSCLSFTQASHCFRSAFYTSIFGRNTNILVRNSWWEPCMKINKQI